MDNQDNKNEMKQKTTDKQEEIKKIDVAPKDASVKEDHKDAK